MVCLKGILAALVLALVIVFGCLGTPTAAASEQNVMFTVEVDNEDLYVSASLAISVDWQSAVSIDEGMVAIVPYDLSAGVGTLSVWVPLSEIGYEDDYLDIPIPATPIGQVSISLSQAVTGIPAAVASVDVVIEASVSVSKVTCSSGNEDVLTQTSTLRWTEWGEKSIQIEPDDADESNVVVTFQYGLSVKVVATLLGYPAGTLVEQTDIAAVEGSPTVSTTISVEKNLLSQYLIPIIIMVVIAVVVVAVAVLLKKRKKQS